MCHIVDVLLVHGRLAKLQKKNYFTGDNQKAVVSPHLDLQPAM